MQVAVEVLVFSGFKSHPANPVTPPPLSAAVRLLTNISAAF